MEQNSPEKIYMPSSDYFKADMLKRWNWVNQSIFYNLENQFHLCRFFNINLKGRTALDIHTHSHCGVRVHGLMRRKHQPSSITNGRKISFTSKLFWLFISLRRFNAFMFSWWRGCLRKSNKASIDTCYK